MQDCASVSNIESTLQPDSLNDDFISDEKQRSNSVHSFCCTAPRNSLNGQQFYSLVNVPSSYCAMENVKQKRTSRLLDRPELFVHALTEKLKGPWIEQVFLKRECIKYIPTFGTNKCGCGLSLNAHSSAVISQFRATVTDDEAAMRSPSTSTSSQSIRWSITKHTKTAQTDAFGTLEFSGGAHAHKAHYVRLGYDSDPSDIMYLMEKVWGLEPPRLVITVHGEKLGQVFREGMLKAAQTTGAWIITAGIDAGVVRHVATALDEAGISARMRSKVVTIGIAPWGLLKRHEKLIGKDIVVSYDPHSFSSKSKYGADIILRRRFEEFIARKQTIGLGTRHVPVVCAVLEGGTCTIRAILQYLANQPPVPVIVCDGSGRASDLIAFAHRHILENGSLSRKIRAQLLTLITSVFRYSTTPPEQILEEILCCAKHRDLLTVFRLSENKKQDVDHAILSAILKGQNLSAADQLALTLVWNRVDIARSDIFISNQSWNPHLLYNAMMEALALDRVDFVKLLLENGVSMKKFLTISRLEQLYNMEQDLILPLINDSTAIIDSRITLPKIGVVIERLMGNAYKCSYTSRKFKNKYEKCKKKALDAKSNVKKRLRKDSKEGDDFQFPFNDLMLWAVLSRRQEMARCMWMYGEEAMAKALAAVRLYKSMSKEAADEYIEVEVSNELREFAEEFKRESLSLLNHCYLQDDAGTLRLLTAELPNWGHHTCLSLAVVANNRRFLAHPCCQILLADLWHGGLGIKSILLLDVKARISNRRIDSFTEQSFVLEGNESSNEKDDDDRSQNSACSSPAAAHVKIRRKTKYKTAAFSQRMNNFFETANLIEETLRFRSGLKASRKSVGASLQVEELARRTSWTTKFTVFYSAPITTFWIWLASYFIFLSIYTYVILIEFPVNPTKVEWFLFAYVIAFVMEHFRKLLVQEAGTICEKTRVYFDRCWNYLTCLAIVTFFIGFGFRCNQLTRHSYGRVILSCNIVFWYIKLLDFMGVHPRLGPYIQMTGKMIVNMMYILALLLVTLMSFGISRQAITYPHEKWQWLLIRNIFYKPYFMLYGEVYAGEIDTCGDEGINCVPGGWIPPILMTIFLLVANILLINMLIAIFNNIFNETNAIAQQVWLFQRYEQVMEYENTPFFPPPFTPISHLFILFRYLWKSGGKGGRRRRGTNKRGGFFDFSMKLSLSDEELRLLHDFEEDCMDDLSRKKIISQTVQTDYHLKTAVERTNSLQLRLNSLVNEDCNMKSFLREIEAKLYVIEKNQQAMLKILQNSAENERNSKNSSGTAKAERMNYQNVTEQKSLIEQMESEMHSNGSSGDEERSRRLQHRDELSEVRKVHEITKKSFILRDEVYTSITDTIEMPKVLRYPDDSFRPVASPGVPAAEFGDATHRNFEEVPNCRIRPPLWSVTDICRTSSREESDKVNYLSIDTKGNLATTEPCKLFSQEKNSVRSTVDENQDEYNISVAFVRQSFGSSGISKHCVNSNTSCSKRGSTVRRVRRNIKQMDATVHAPFCIPLRQRLNHTAKPGDEGGIPPRPLSSSHPHSSRVDSSDEGTPMRSESLNDDRLTRIAPVSASQSTVISCDSAQNISSKSFLLKSVTPYVQQASTVPKTPSEFAQPSIPPPAHVISGSMTASQSLPPPHCGFSVPAVNAAGIPRHGPYCDRSADDSHYKNHDSLLVKELLQEGHCCENAPRKLRLKTTDGPSPVLRSTYGRSGWQDSSRQSTLPYPGPGASRFYTRPAPSLPLLPLGQTYGRSTPRRLMLNTFPEPTCCETEPFGETACSALHGLRSSSEENEQAYNTFYVGNAPSVATSSIMQSTYSGTNITYTAAGTAPPPKTFRGDPNQVVICSSTTSGRTSTYPYPSRSTYTYAESDSEHALASLKEGYESSVYCRTKYGKKTYTTNITRPSTTIISSSLRKHSNQSIQNSQTSSIEEYQQNFKEDTSIGGPITSMSTLPKL
uniref:TRPM SLOG domain-containing protein n=1 Tax=Setaria digitata TaxID=48799 RepID=A0A915PI99_9BILA